jgi:hypothetical protein
MKIGDKELRITPATFDEAMDLKDAVEDAVKSGKLNIDIEEAKEGIDNISSVGSINSESLTSLINTILSIDNSKTVRKSMFVCAERALLGNDKINKDFFEKVENREYYYEIMFEIIKVNLMPFFKGLFSKLSGSGIMGSLANILKPK